jgi:hypothetical protein
MSAMPTLTRRAPAADPVPPPRSPERERLAVAISTLAQCTYEADRVEEARQKLDERFFDVLQPAVTAAREALTEAEELAPNALVDAVLEGGISEDATAVAKINLRQAEVAVEQTRSARRVLENRAQDAQIDIGNARRNLDAAVAAVIQSDPAKKAVVSAFFAAGRRTLQLARAIRTMGIIAQGVEAVDIGLTLRIGDILKPGGSNTGQSSFQRDPDWAAAVAALRDDADVALPGLPAEDDAPAGDATKAA